MILHALALLCALAAPVFAATPGPGRWRLSLAAAGAAALTAWLRGRVPDVGAAGAIVAAAAALQLFRPGRFHAWMAVAAGAVAAIGAAVLGSEGLPLIAANIVAAVPVGTASFLASTRPRFAPPVLREEALLIVLALAISVAVAPGLSAGWRSAQGLNAPGAVNTAPSMPAWTLAAAAGFLALGGAYSAWRHQ